eukprot:1175467-Amphidinium_carterae.1
MVGVYLACPWPLWLQRRGLALAGPVAFDLASPPGQVGTPVSLLVSARGSHRSTLGEPPAMALFLSEADATSFVTLLEISTGLGGLGDSDPCG